MSKTREVLFFDAKTFNKLENELSPYFVNHKHFAAGLIDLVADLKGEDLLSLPALLRSNFHAKKRRGRPPTSGTVSNGDALKSTENHEV
jgi:hypothetical protein